MNDANTYILDHPLIRHKLAHLRRGDTPGHVFRDLMKEITILLGYEVLRDMPTKDIEIETPMEQTTAQVLEGRKHCLVSILRGGNGLLNGMLELMPLAKVGHIGLYRDPDRLIPVEYFLKLPDDLHEREVIILDPMLATGKSAIAAIDRVKSHDAVNVKFLCIVAAPEGIAAVREEYPDLPIYTAAIDRGLDEKGHILPGIGDAGDRLYGSK
ncbi:MAG: uracil phosphoribosyltransferase [Rhodospirillales bacterium]|nr:uracil phosphoribosyltransferase [Rhodospirillales bacterium]MCB9996228.1 uracil phosphoribosyltransferase [Rhodospirillales bacterium]